MKAMRANDGAEIVFVDDGDGPPLLLLHGWGAHSGFFAPQRAALADHFRVLAPDFRGGGLTGASYAPPSIERLAADVEELLETLQLNNVLAIGWSMGAMVLWSALLGRAAARFRGAVVVDMSPMIVPAPDWPHGLKGGHDLVAAERAMEAMQADWPGFCRLFAQRLFAEGKSAERADLIRWAESEAATGDPVALAPLWGSMARQDYRARLADISVPTLIVSGGRSQLYGPGAAQALAALTPQARTHVYERSGHAPHLEEPERFNTDLKLFARELDARGRSGARQP